MRLISEMRFMWSHHDHGHRGPFEKAGDDVGHKVDEAIDKTFLGGGGGGVRGTHTGDASGWGGDRSHGETPLYVDTVSDDPAYGVENTPGTGRGDGYQNP